MVAYAQNPTQSHPYGLRMDTPVLPAGLVLVGDVPQVTVTAIGTSDHMRAFDIQRDRGLEPRYEAVKISDTVRSVHSAVGVDEDVHLPRDVGDFQRAEDRLAIALGGEVVVEGSAVDFDLPVARRDAHASTQAQHRIEHRPVRAREGAAVECTGVLRRASPADESGAGAVCLR